MTDKEIIEAFIGCCISHRLECEDCIYGNRLDCTSDLYADIIALVDRQQAEIERLKTEKDNLIKTYSECQIDFLKEFAEKLEADIGNEDFYIQDKLLLIHMIDNLVKEMVGAEQ